MTITKSSQVIALGSIIMIMFCTIIVVFVVYGQAPPTVKANCDEITYSANWTLEQLRNITAYCSNGGVDQ